MKKILYLILREYYTRIRKKLFIISTILIPIFTIALLSIQAITFSYQYKSTNIAIITSDTIYRNILNENGIKVKLYSKETNLSDLIDSGKYSYIIKINHSSKNIPECISYISEKIEPLIVYKIENSILNHIINNYYPEDKGEEISNERTFINYIKRHQFYQETRTGNASPNLCLYVGIATYILITILCTQVMRGIQEEKQNKISEILLTSVSAYKFLIGKIIGIALLGLTQILTWALIMKIIRLNIPFAKFIPCMFDFGNITISDLGTNEIDSTFIFYYIPFWILGFMLYASMFTIISSISKAENSNQLAFVISFPLIISIILLADFPYNSNNTISKFLSYIPFTSPICMPGRIIYTVNDFEVILSLSILLCTALGTLFLSSKIYKYSITQSLNNIKNMIDMHKHTKL